MIFFKKKKVKVKCYPQFDQVGEIFPVELARKYIPDWWKNLPSQVNIGLAKEITTIKSCPGFTELYKTGITFPLWRDCVIKYDRHSIVEIEIPTNENPNNYFVSHNVDQMGKVFDPWIHLKILSPWYLETEEPIPFLMTDMTYNRKTLSGYQIPPGVLEFKYQHATHINMFLEPTDTFRELSLNAGTPLIHLIPLADVEIELEICKYNADKLKSMQPWHWTFNNLYTKTRNIIEKRK